tara:strand:+ start:275 stop:1630 length:1356 start_codon:yes stop_codon:yes gene_type:complete
MPINPPVALTAALLIGLSSTTSAITSPESFDSSDQFSSEQANSTQMSTQMMAINDAVEATKTDPSAMCFVVILPENYGQARSIRDQWTTARKNFNQTDHPVFFVRGEDAQFVMESAYIESAPATISFRNGRPYHSRTGLFTDKNLQSFLALAFDNSAPTTNAPDQTEFLYNTMNDLALAGQDPTAAQGACQIMLNLHALIQGPYASTYTTSDLDEMTTLYNQTQLTLATLNTNDQSVLDQINHTRAIAIKTWNKRTNSTFGFGIWSDLAMITGDTDSVLTWIDEGIDNPSTSKRVAQTLADYGQPLAQLLIETHRYEALALTITSPTQIAEQLATATTLAEEINAINPSATNPMPGNPSESMILAATEQAAAYHAALLLVGRDSEAWQVAQLTEQFAGPSISSAALCSAAINAGTLTDRHAFLVRNLDQTQHASLINAMNTSFAIVPGTDD